jgi:peptidyl-prolyl cis-trans isomerase B (cyclophilin B)
MTFDAAPDESLAENAVWEATITTNCGDITVDLFGDKAPQTVASFIHLAQEGYWVDSPCHRLVTSGIFVLQCGDPTASGGGNPGYGYGVENAPANGTYPRGTLAMARTSDPNTNGGQWFIVYDQTSLPDATGYSIFGKVTSGMAVVDAIAEAGNAADGVAPAEPISILDIALTKKT